MKVYTAKSIQGLRAVATFICLAFLCILLALAPYRHAMCSANTQAHKKEIAEVEAYLNNIKTLQAEFIQFSKGEVAKGSFYMIKPKKLLKLHYKSGTPVTIYVEGDRLIYYDRKLNQVSEGTTEGDLASIILQQNLTLEGKRRHIKSVHSSKKGIMVTMSLAKNGGISGKTFSLYFKKDGGSITLYRILTEQGNKKLDINLLNIKENAPILEDTFKIPYGVRQALGRNHDDNE